MLLTLIFLILVGVAAEVVVRIAPEFLHRSSRVTTVREKITAARNDVAESAKKVDTLAASLKAVRQELARAKEAIVDLDRELEKRGKVDPVLVFLIGKTEDGVTLYRAPLKKTVSANAEKHQRQIWRRTCFVEVAAYSRAQAVVEANLQFSSRVGYQVGTFSEHKPAAAEEPESADV